MTEPITLAFAGEGELDPENVKALLNDYLGFGDEDKDGYPEPPDRDITIYLPLSKDLLTQAVEEIYEWTGYADLPFHAVVGKDSSKKADRMAKDAESVIQATNVPKKLIELLREAEGEKYLVLAWGEDGGETGEMLLDLADAAGVKALDMAPGGLDDLVFSDDSDDAAPEPEPDPEPKPAPSRRGGRRGKAAPAELSDEPEELTEQKQPSAVEKAKAEAAEFGDRLQKAKDRANAKLRSKDELQETVNIQAQAAQSRSLADDVQNRLSFHPATEKTAPLFEDNRRAAIDFAEVLVNNAPQSRELSLALTKLQEALMWANAAIACNTPSELPQKQAEKPAETISKVSAEDSPRRGRGRPRKDGSPAQPRTGEEPSPYLKHPDGTYTKRGRGRIPAGSEVVMLTPSEVDELGDAVEE